ncbi:MAG: hypothetical protein NT159_25000 [Proteobacteria bacterium]|nr:hypothetical protein [Pseudomonadota bacterium]
MATPEILVISILRVLTEVALLTLLGQGLLALLAGGRRATNPVYQLFDVITRPAIKAVRFITPKLIIDRHLPFLTFFLLFWLWIFLAYLKRMICEMNGLSCLGA